MYENSENSLMFLSHMKRTLKNSNTFFIEESFGANTSQCPGSHG